MKVLIAAVWAICGSAIGMAVSASPRTVLPSHYGERGMVQFDRRDHDFGLVQQGQVLETRFSFQNFGKGPVNIQAVHSSCRCVEVILNQDLIVAPGSKSEVGIRFRTDAFLGFVNLPITVLFGASHQRGHVLSLKGLVASALTINPPLVDFGNSVGSRSQVKFVSLTGPAAIGLSRDDVQFDPEQLDVELRTGKDGVLLAVHRKMSIQTDNLRSQITIAKGADRLVLGRIPVVASTASSVTLDQSFVDFGMLAGELTSERELVLHSASPFQVRTVQATIGQMTETPLGSDHFEALVSEKESDKHTIRVRLKGIPSDSTLGSFRGKILIATSGSDSEVIEIPLFGHQL